MAVRPRVELAVSHDGHRGLAHRPQRCTRHVPGAAALSGAASGQRAMELAILRLAYGCGGVCLHRRVVADDIGGHRAVRPPRTPRRRAAMALARMGKLCRGGCACASGSAIRPCSDKRYSALLTTRNSYDE